MGALFERTSLDDNVGHRRRVMLRVRTPAAAFRAG